MDTTDGLRSTLAIALLACVTSAQDILVVVMDDVAAEDLALYGGPIPTPYIEALALKGVTFTNAYANPTCAPSRRSLLTGHWWSTGNGLPCSDLFQAETPPAQELFLPEMLPGHNSALIGKWHLGGSPTGGRWECAPVEQGFGVWLAGSPSNVRECGGHNYFDWTRTEACRGRNSRLYEPSVVTDATTDFWRNTPSPRLAVVCPNLGHEPFHRPPDELLPPGYPPTVGGRAKFEAMTIALDTLIGEILTEVDLAHTLVIVVGDNGTPPDVAPDPNRAKGTTYRRGIHVPLIVAGGPVVGAGRTTPELVHIVDLWRTCLDWGGGSLPAAGRRLYPLASRSFLPVLRMQASKPREYVLAAARWGIPTGDRCIVSADGFKLRQLDDDGDGRADREELYDLRRDPDELVDRGGEAAFAHTASSLRAILETRSLP